jgi:hypothetical protein
VGNIEIRIKAIGEKDGTVRLSNGQVIGRIDDNLNIFDQDGKKIGFKIAEMNAY